MDFLMFGELTEKRSLRRKHVNPKAHRNCMKHGPSDSSQVSPHLFLKSIHKGIHMGVRHCAKAQRDLLLLLRPSVVCAHVPEHGHPPYIITLPLHSRCKELLSCSTAVINKVWDFHSAEKAVAAFASWCFYRACACARLAVSSTYACCHGPWGNRSHA